MVSGLEVSNSGCAAISACTAEVLEFSHSSSREVFISRIFLASSWLSSLVTPPKYCVKKMVDPSSGTIEIARMNSDHFLCTEADLLLLVLIFVFIQDFDSFSTMRSPQQY
ncbi:hypothetical protein D3C73_1103390 [compost metagenome]